MNIKMERNIRTLLATVVTLPALLGPAIAWGLSAKLLPEGVTRLRVYENVGSTDGWFSDSSDRQPLGQLGLDKLKAKGIAPSTTNVYTIGNSARYRLWRTDVTLDYGWTANLDVGVWLPYYSHTTRQSATLTQGAAWSALTAAQKASISGAASTLDSTDPTNSDFGDVFVGFKHRVYGLNNDPFRFALGGGFRAPTGHVANPLDANDVATGDGQWDVTLATWTDFQVNDRFFINFLTRHDYGLADYRDAVFPTNASQAGRMRFQPGITHHLEWAPQYQFPFEKWDLLSEVTLIYDRQEKEKRQSFDTAAARYSGPLAATNATDWDRWMIKPSLGARLFKYGVPGDFYLSYAHTMAGKNTADLDLLEMRMDIYFKGLDQ
ncbi:MAG: transporter [Magnetococcales bacterium]|nr:transporter [Magnetococcales bacterium]